MNIEREFNDDETKLLNAIHNRLEISEAELRALFHVHKDNEQLYRQIYRGIYNISNAATEISMLITGFTEEK